VASLNKVFLMGNLTRDPELRYIPSGTAVCEFGLAMNREYQDRTSGERKEDVCFVDVVVWAKQAETCNQYLSKGRSVFVEGRLQYEQWEKEGAKRSRLRVVADRVQFLGSPKDGGGRREGAAASASPAPAKAAARSEVRDGPPPGPGGGEDLNLDDIPF
jgi:single-strand DNA-binding protein